MFILGSLLVAFSSLRGVLFLRFGGPASLTVGKVAELFLRGLHRDLVVALWLVVPLCFWFWICPNRWFRARWHRCLLLSALFAFWAGEVFLLFAEYYFFDEFKSRFNTVAVDYLIYPYEVFVNIWQSYPVGVVAGVCAGAALGWVVVAARAFGGMWEQNTTARLRCGGFALVLGAGVALGGTVRFKDSRFTDDRTLNEIANNGALAFLAAAWTHNLDYRANYQTVGETEAYQRVRRLLRGPGMEFTESGNSIRRRVQGDPTKPRLNVVILLEESLGSEFWGCLGRRETLTPEMDRLATREGLLFTNIYASGNRTVRGFEGVLSSFPPLPGDSIVKRDRSDNVETIARVLKRDGYATMFLYGGCGFFDGMRSYALRNGYDRFLEHNPPFNDDLPHPNFATSWGVADEEVFARAIKEFRALNESGRPFLGTILSVSNHKPYTYPRGRVPDDPEKPRPSRKKAVKYSDWCLGQFFQAAKQEKFWTNTIFVVVADHGARVYGHQSIPIHSYEIPLVILGPAVVPAPARLGQLGCSLDVAPTVLGLLGRPYETLFFGRDLFKCAPDEGRAFLNHNRDIGMLARDRLVVLGLMRNEEFYAGDPKRVDVRTLAQPNDADRELQRDAIAVYQVADDLYMHERYRIDGTTLDVVDSRPPADPAAKAPLQR